MQFALCSSGPDTSPCSPLAPAERCQGSAVRLRLLLTDLPDQEHPISLKTRTRGSPVSLPNALSSQCHHQMWVQGTCRAYLPSCFTEEVVQEQGDTSAMCQEQGKTQGMSLQLWHWRTWGRGHTSAPIMCAVGAVMWHSLFMNSHSLTKKQT